MLFDLQDICKARIEVQQIPYNGYRPRQLTRESETERARGVQLAFRASRSSDSLMETIGTTRRGQTHRLETISQLRKRGEHTCEQSI